MRLCIAVYDDGPDVPDLIRRAQAAWTSFGLADIHPLGRTRPFLYIDVDSRVGDYAGIELKRDGSIQLLLATPLLRQLPDGDQRLTLLHECIHMEFALGVHYERWRRVFAFIAKEWHDVQLAIPQTAEEWRQYSYRKTRVLNAVLLLKLPDEIVAEQHLKANFRPWFNARANYYMRMRQNRGAALAASVLPAPLRPFEAFYEMIRNSLFITLVADIEELQAERAELSRLEANAEVTLRNLGPAELVDFLLNLKPALADIQFDEPFPDAEAAYDRLYQRMVGTELPPIPTPP